MKYEVYGRGGSLSEIIANLAYAEKKATFPQVGKMWLVGTADSKEEAKLMEKMFKKQYPSRKAQTRIRRVV